MATNTLTSRNHLSTLTVDVEGPGGSVQTVTLDGAWKTTSGGGLTAENTKNRPGGMADEETIPGVPSREDLTLTREFKLGRDSSLVGPGGVLEKALKTGAPAAVTQHDMTHGGVVPAGNQARIWRGVISSVSMSDQDSESSEVKTITVVLSVVA